MFAFLSYQTADKAVAADVRYNLDTFGVKSFLAHEDIEISTEWQNVILEQLKSADIFVPILSAAYLVSSYCLQESGIAIFRGMSIIPLSIDGTVPPGFLKHIQSSKVEPGVISPRVLLTGLAHHDLPFAIDCMIKRFRGSGSYRGAEANFEILSPYLDKATDVQIKAILESAVNNSQIAHASRCAGSFLPPLLQSHGHHLAEQDREHLASVFERYT